MKKRLRHIPFFLFLLPLFFVFHGYVGHWGYIQSRYCLKLLCLYTIETAVIYGLLYAIWRTPVNTAFLTAYLMFFNFVFGYLQDLLIVHLPALNRYRIILPFFLVVAVLLAIHLRKSSKRLERQTLFLNILLLAWILADGASLVTVVSRPGHRGIFTAASPQPEPGIDSPGNKGPDPDIYFLVFDEYASSVSLKNYYGYENGNLDNWLRKQGFSIQSGSFSNYNYTPLSIASILNMSYLGGIKPEGCNENDFASCEKLIRNNLVTESLAARGYAIRNYSIFDLENHPSIVDQRMLPLRDRLIVEGTFTYRISDELGWHHYERWPFLKWFLSHIPYETLENDNVLMEKAERESRQAHTHPIFAYAHFEMPHAPFIFAADGRLKSPKELSIFETIEDTASYAGYLLYTNVKLKRLISTIQQNTQNKAVIIVMGDHGFRCEIPGGDHLHYFQNLNAVFFPDKDYRLLYDSISGVNQFRVVLNQLFDQQWPMLKDSMRFVLERK